MEFARILFFEELEWDYWFYLGLKLESELGI
jgi:hypothetical protein